MADSREKIYNPNIATMLIGWFVVVAELPKGQISNHYKMLDWNLFKCKEVNMAPEWDGHTPQDVLERLKDLI